ncbi:hypothetical protein GH733_009414 [Mirounga leonina]|nr:hypothetical protein GH733_009414 [Mirounga leonina]
MAELAVHKGFWYLAPHKAGHEGGGEGGPHGPGAGPVLLVLNRRFICSSPDCNTNHSNAWKLEVHLHKHTGRHPLCMTTKDVAKGLRQGLPSEPPCPDSQGQGKPFAQLVAVITNLTQNQT